MKAAYRLKCHFIRLISRFIVRAPRRKPNPNVAIYFKDDAIGDFLFGTAMIRELSAKYSTAYLVCTPALRPLAELYLPPERILTVDKEKFDSALAYRVKQLRSWLALEPSIVVMSSLRSSFVDQVAKHFAAAKTILVSTDDPAAKKRRRRHIYSRLADLPSDDEISTDFLCGAHRKEHLLIEAAVGERANPRLSRPFIPIEKLPSPEINRYFCFLPDTGDPRRTYPLTKLLDVISRASAEIGFKPVVLSAKPLATEVANRLPDGSLNLTGRTTLTESMSLLAHAEFVLTNETGLGHASWIMGRKTIMIMPGGNFLHFHAKDPALMAVYDQRECFNCQHRCRFEYKEQFPCVRDIPLAKIEGAIKTIFLS